MTPAVPCRDNPWTCPICDKRPCRCVSFDANPEWVDEIVVEQAAAGRDTSRPLTEAEKLLVARELHRRGVSLNTIAARLHMRHGAARAAVDEAPA